ncbi:hypothetical protein D9M69_525320 [compost metagenome]
MEFPEVFGNAAHQAEQEERESVLLQGEAGHQCKQDGKAGEANSTAEPDAKGLGAVSLPGGSEGGVHPNGASDFSCSMEVGKTATSRKELRMGAEEVFRLSRKSELGVRNHCCE